MASASCRADVKAAPLSLLVPVFCPSPVSWELSRARAGPPMPSQDWGQPRSTGGSQQAAHREINPAHFSHQQHNTSGVAARTPLPRAGKEERQNIIF